MSDPHPPQALSGICFEPLPVHLRPVLGALLSGATDAAASHRLNVSPRTFSRRLAELLEYFGARTRFQAGVTFGLRRGWPSLYDHGGLSAVEDWAIAGRDGSIRLEVEAEILRAVTLPPVIGGPGDMLGGR